MDQNKIPSNEPNETSNGFDSVSKATPTPEESFNPTPMFSNSNGQSGGYTVTPNGSFYNKPAEPTEPKEAVPPAEQPVEKAEAPKAPEATEPAKPEATKTPDFIPSGTYSYSAAKGNLQSGAYDAPEMKPEESAPTFEATPNYHFTPNTPPTPKKDKKNKKYGAGVIIVSALLAAVIGAGGGIGAMVALGNKLPTSTSSEATNTPQNVTNITVDETVNSSIEAVAKKAGPSIVGIRTTAAVMNFFGGSSEATGEGSGIIYSTDGYVITNYHVIESAVESSNSKVEVFLPEDTDTAITAKIIGYNIASDLAVVKIEKTGLAAIEFADSDKLSVGQYAIAIGNPGGLEFIGSVSSGIISGLNRSVSVDSGNTMSLIQTDAAINPGNSGGALVDINGKLIGVNSVKLVSTGYEGMGFAIPSNTVKEICDKIISKQNSPAPYIGIEISRNYTANQLKALGYPAGAVVVSVTEGGPADESDIQRGDIITEFNGTAIDSYSDLENAISQCEPGDTVTVKIFRTGRFYSASINVKANNAQ